jgi:hypothetical protein
MCGSAPNLIVGYSPLDHAFVDCDCGMQTAPKDTAEEVTEMWNRRSPTPQADAAPSDPLRAAVESMVTMLEAGEWAEHASTFKAPGDALASRLESAITDLHNQIDEARAAIAAGGAQEAVAWRGAPLSLIPNLVDSNKVAVNVALLEMGDAMSTWRTESEKYGEITSRAQSAFCDGYEAGIAAILCALAEHAAPLPRIAATVARSDEQIEAVIEESDGHWHDDEFRINGKDLMNLCRSLLAAASNGEQS